MRLNAKTNETIKKSILNLSTLWFKRRGNVTSNYTSRFLVKESNTLKKAEINKNKQRKK